MVEKIIVKPEPYVQVLKDLFSAWKRFLNKEDATRIMQSVIDSVYGKGESDGQS